MKETEFESWLQNTKHANWAWEEDAKESWYAALCWVKELLVELNKDEVEILIDEELARNSEKLN